MEIYIKTLSGCVQPLSFSHKDVTIKILKEITNRSGYNICFFREIEEDSKEESSKYLGDDEMVFNGEVLNIFYIKEDFTKEDNEKFESSLKNLLKKFYVNFRESIIKYDAIIAGGSVLSVFGGYNINDLDIYVHYSKAQDFIKTLFIHGCSYSNIHEAPAYDQSFFRKNNIKARVCMGYHETNYETEEQRRQRRVSGSYPRYTSIDIMIIPDHITLESVVTNFDLTFCQVWWDGKRLFSDNIEDVKSKSGCLNKDYISAYLSMNTFIIKRIQKYKNRGFTINIDLSDFQSSIISKKDAKTIYSCHNIWAKSCLSKYLIHQFFNKYREYHMLSYFKIKETIEYIEDCIDLSKDLVYKDLVYKALVQNCYEDVLTTYNKANKTYKKSFIDTFDEILKVKMSYSERSEIIKNWISNIKLESEKELESMKEDREIVLKYYKESRGISYDN